MPSAESTQGVPSPRGSFRWVPGLRRRGHAPATDTYSINWCVPEDFPCSDTPYNFENCADFVTNDEQVTGEDCWSIPYTVPCVGCTLTPGYWKTHSEFGPAPYDETWDELLSGASTPFFLSGQTYYQVLWTPPQAMPTTTWPSITSRRS